VVDFLIFGKQLRLLLLSTALQQAISGIAQLTELLASSHSVIREMGEPPSNQQVTRDVKPRGQNFRPRPHPRAMLALFSWRMFSWPSSQSSISRHLHYVLLWWEIVACFIFI